MLPIRSLTSAFFAASFLAFAAPASRAQVPLLSNLDATSSGMGGSLTSAGQQLSVAFTTGGNRLQLSSLDAYLGRASAGLSVLSFALYTASVPNGSDPGALVASLGTASVNAPTVYNFVPSSATTLDANTRYVLLADYVSGPTGVWIFASPQVAPTARSGSGITGVQYRASSDNGVSYTDSNFNGLFSLNGNVVAAPEPSALALLSFATLPGFALVSRRTRV